MDSSQSDKVEMREISDGGGHGKKWYRLRFEITHKRIYITSALIKLLNLNKIVFAQHPDREQDWYIRAVSEDEKGITVRKDHHCGGVLAGATVFTAIEESLDYKFVENISIPVSTKPERINNLDYYPIITKALKK